MRKVLPLITPILPGGANTPAAKSRVTRPILPSHCLDTIKPQAGLAGPFRGTFPGRTNRWHGRDVLSVQCTPHCSWPRPSTKLLTNALRRRACLRRICMTAVRRLMLLTCAVAVLPLSAQTSRGTKTTQTPAPSPAPAAAAASTPAPPDVPRTTPPLTADTHPAANNPPALP